MRFSQLNNTIGNRFKQRVVPMFNGVGGIYTTIIKVLSGNPITIGDASNEPLKGLRLFGKSTQDGTPTPTTPVEIVSVENPTVNVDEQTFSIPYTLRGIPVTSGGNYTDSNGQQWICDEVDFERGVYVQRVGRTDEVTISAHSVLANGLAYGVCVIPDKKYQAKNGLISNIVDYITSPAATTEHSCYENSMNVVFVGNSTDTKTTLEEKFNGSTLCYVLETPIETPLTADQLEAYKSLHTNEPNTTIHNDQNAFMEVTYIAK